MSRIYLPIIIWWFFDLFVFLFFSGLPGHNPALGFSWPWFKECSLCLGLEKRKNAVYGSWSYR